MISILLFTKYGDNIFLIRKKRDGDHILMLIYRTMGILSSSKIFTKHGDKMIFKNPILSPSKLYDNGDLVSIKTIYEAWEQDDFHKSYLVSIKNI